MVANGVFMSKLCFLIQVWGGSSEFLLKALQVIQSKAARIITKMSWFTPTRLLLKQCNWLSVRQLVHYHSILTTHKVVSTGRPEYLHNKMCREHQYNTRHSVKFGENFGGRSALASNSFCYRGVLSYGQIPQNIRQLKSFDSFKSQLKAWIMKNIEVR